MRIISQYKEFDVSYENNFLKVIENYSQENTFSIVINSEFETIDLGVYSNMTKISRVMEMIRKTVNGEESHNFRITYKGIYGNWITELIDTLYTYDKVKEIAKKFIEDNEDYTEYDINVSTYLGNKCNYFYMPQDDEVCHKMMK